MAFTIDPGQAFNGDQGASNLLGQMYRAEWEDWKSRYAPYITKLKDFATDTNYAANQGQEAATAIDNSYANTQQGLQMSQQGMGMNMTAAQKTAQDRTLALGQAADSASSYNSAKISARDLQDQVLAGSGGLSNVPLTGVGAKS